VTSMLVKRQEALSGWMESKQQQQGRNKEIKSLEKSRDRQEFQERLRSWEYLTGFWPKHCPVRESQTVGLERLYREVSYRDANKGHMRQTHDALSDDHGSRFVCWKRRNTGAFN
jgi:hypothetical protein